MNKNFLIPLGVVAFAITLAMVVRDSLSGEAQLVAFGIAIGLIAGVPVGMASMALARRADRASQAPAPPSTGLSLSPDQTALLLRAIERQQASPSSFGLTAREGRTFTAVGGADVSGGSADGEERH